MSAHLPPTSRAGFSSVLLVLLTSGILLTSAAAQDEVRARTPDNTAACLDSLEEGALTGPLKTIVVPELGVVLDLPTTHSFGGSDGQWYAYGFHDGEPLVPDVSLRYVQGATLEETFPDIGVTRLGRPYADELVFIESPGELPDGTLITVERYALPLADGLLLIDRYEGFDWACFDLVASSVRTFQTAQ